MEFHVTNRTIHVGGIHVVAVAITSTLLVGDAGKITLNSLIDTPPQSVEFLMGPEEKIPDYGPNGGIDNGGSANRRQ